VQDWVMIHIGMGLACATPYWLHNGESKRWLYFGKPWNYH